MSCSRRTHNQRVGMDLALQKSHTLSSSAFLLWIYILFLIEQVYYRPMQAI
jgi:hypothetical protein